MLASSTAGVSASSAGAGRLDFGRSERARIHARGNLDSAEGRAPDRRAGRLRYGRIDTELGIVAPLDGRQLGDT